MANKRVQFNLSKSSSIAKRGTCFQRYVKELRSRSLNVPAWLLVIYAVAIACCGQLAYSVTLGLPTRPETLYPYIGTHSSTGVRYAVSYSRSLIHLFFYVCMGWMSDIKLGRKRAIGLSLWASWWGALLELISLCIQFGANSSLSVNIAKYCLSVIALLLLLLGSATFFVNMLAYGLDQLVDKSSTHIRAYTHWLVWGFFIGLSTGFLGSVREREYNSKLTLITGLVIFGVISLAVCIDSHCYKYFKPSSVLTDNPYKLVVNVLLYAYQHKHMRNRSAFTYWEQDTPNRINMAKQKYGGPYTNEAIENVKTFLRIIAICFSAFGFYIPFSVIYGQAQVNRFSGSTDTLNGYGSYVLWSACDKIVLFLVPLYELVLVPLFPKVEYFFLNSLRWLGISYVLLFLSLLSTFALGVAGEILTSHNVDCTSQTGKFDISFLYFIVPLFLYGLVDTINIISGLEFIGSQAPINMSGMLTGVFWFVRSIYIDIGHTITISFAYINEGPVSCNFWIVLTQLIICIGGFVIYIRMAKWYQNRVRNDQTDRAIIEEAFTRRLNVIETETSSTHDDDDTLKDYVIETIHQ